MSDSKDDVEVAELSEIYDVLKSDARTIVNDLRGGVTMWREAAGANIAAAGFILILSLTDLHYDILSGAEGNAILIAQLLVAGVLLAFAVFGLRRYLQLRRRYEGLFERTKKLE